MDGAFSSNKDALLNISRDSEALYYDPSDDENSSNRSYNDDTGDSNSTDDKPELELLDGITVEDITLVMNGSSVESHQARLALVLMLLIMVEEKNTRRRRFRARPWYRR